MPNFVAENVFYLKTTLTSDYPFHFPYSLMLTSLVSLMETMKSKKGSSPALCPGEFSWTCMEKIL